MAQKTLLEPVGLPGRRYGSFASKTGDANPHPVSKITQASPCGLPARRYGSFASKSAAANPHPVAKITQRTPCGLPGRRYGSFATKQSVTTRNVTLTISKGAVDPDTTFTNYKVSLTGGPDPRSAVIDLSLSTYTFSGVSWGAYTATEQLSNAAGTTVDTGQSTKVSFGIVLRGHPQRHGADSVLPILVSWDGVTAVFRHPSAVPIEAIPILTSISSASAIAALLPVKTRAQEVLLLPSGGGTAVTLFTDSVQQDFTGRSTPASAAG